ncbi:MAG: transcriptional regulator [Methanobrevibacter sp.]|jgi:putative transcriptional regulator|nr:transcriptional regulator [Candidatus Methanovirga australis]
MNLKNRNNIIDELIQLLLSEGFETSNIYEKSCFDMFAKRELLLLLFKVLVNIDSIDEAQANEIKKISSVFLASPLIIGLKSRNTLLLEDVVYERYGVSAIGVKTLKNMIVYDEYPEILADRGGYYVQINGDVLREYREEYSLSLKNLADLANVSRETIYKYENNLVRASPEIAMVLEEILNMKITLNIDFFEFKDLNNDIEVNHDLNNNETRNLANLGFNVVPTKKTPFDVLSKLENPKYSFITSLEENRISRTLHKIALSLKDLSLITGSESFFIINNEKFKGNIDGIPVVSSWELKESNDSSELLKIVKERRDN